MSESNGQNGNGKHPKKMGRPKFPWTPRLEMLILARLASGYSLVSICRRKRYPSYVRVMERVWSSEDFRKRYATAREQQAERMAEELLDIADDGKNDTQVDEKGRRIVDFDHINRSRLRVDTRKWIASKLLPKKYGDKTTEINVSTTIVTLDAGKQAELQDRRKKAEAQILLPDKDNAPTLENSAGDLGKPLDA